MNSNFDGNVDVFFLPQNSRNSILPIPLEGERESMAYSAHPIDA